MTEVPQEPFQVVFAHESTRKLVQDILDRYPGLELFPLPSFIVPDDLPTYGFRAKETDGQRAD